MAILSIDTALRTCSLGVMSGEGDVLFSQIIEMPRGQDQALAPAVDQALKTAKISMSDLSAIAVTTGPGSFTGIRVGLAFARGLVSVLKIPLIGLTTTDILSASYTNKVSTVIEIKKDAYIAQIFDNKTPQTQLLSLTEEELKTFIIEQGVEKAVTHSHAVEEMLSIECDIVLPNPQAMLTMARERMHNTDDVVRPIYVRGADVTVKSNKN